MVVEGGCCWHWCQAIRILVVDAGVVVVGVLGGGGSRVCVAAFAGGGGGAYDMPVCRGHDSSTI